MGARHPDPQIQLKDGIVASAIEDSWLSTPITVVLGWDAAATNGK